MIEAAAAAALARWGYFEGQVLRDLVQLAHDCALKGRRG